VGLDCDLGPDGDVGLGTDRPPTNRASSAGRTRSVAALIVLVALAAAAVVAATAGDLAATTAREPAGLATFAVLAVSLQLVAGLYGRGSMSVAGLGVLGAGLALGIGASVAIATLCAAAHFARRRGRLERALFSASTLALAAGAGSGFYHLFETGESPAFVRLGLALGAGGLSWAVNIGLLTAAMSLSEGRSPGALWRDRFRWLTAHYLSFGPLALAATSAYEALGVPGVLLFALPPALLTVSVRQSVERRRAALDLGLG
jgi:hypothetical protein